MGKEISAKKLTKRSNAFEEKELKKRLESLEGWIWDIAEFKWEEGFSYLQAFVEKEGHARVPQNFKTKDGHNLRSWIHHQRV